MNTSFLGPAVATVLTACGIETRYPAMITLRSEGVATVLTACGIETSSTFLFLNTPLHAVATVLTACGIETLLQIDLFGHQVWYYVATVLTACGIETRQFFADMQIKSCCNSTYRLRY